MTLGKEVHRVDREGLIAFESVQPPHLEVSSHAHPNPSICFVLEGEFEEMGSRPRMCPPGAISLAPAGCAPDLRFGARGARSLILEMGRSWLSECDAELPDVDDAFVVDDPVAQGLATQASVALRERDASRVEETLLTLLLELGRGTPPPPEETRSPGTRLALELVRDCYREQLSLSKVAAAAGMHRVSMARAFRRRFGSSVGDYLQSLRIAHASRLLADRSWSLGEIALDSGFFDQAHFTRIFKRVTGVTPGRFRRQLSPS